MVALCGKDREVIAIWREHGIPLDRSTVDHAAEVIRRLDDDLSEAWRIVDRLMEADDGDREEEWRSLAADVRSFLADLAGDYALSDHVFTHSLFESLTAHIDRMMETTCPT